MDNDDDQRGLSRPSAPGPDLTPRPRPPRQFLQRWLISTVAVLVAEHIVSGISYRTWQDLLVATFLLGLLNTFVKPLLMMVSLPLVILTLGLFTLVVNALLLLFVSRLLQPAFAVSSFGAALLGALVISLVTVALNILTGTGSARIRVQRGPPPARPPDDDGGPVIDV